VVIGQWRRATKKKLWEDSETEWRGAGTLRPAKLFLGSYQQNFINKENIGLTLN